MLCPICQKPAPDTLPPAGERSPYPFCSDRCKLIDLGRWLGGKYQIPVETFDDGGDFPSPDSARQTPDGDGDEP